MKTLLVAVLLLLSFITYHATTEAHAMREDVDRLQSNQAALIKRLDGLEADYDIALTQMADDLREAALTKGVRQ